jgi:hypothetical protein
VGMMDQGQKRSGTLFGATLENGFGQSVRKAAATEEVEASWNSESRRYALREDDHAAARKTAISKSAGFLKRHEMLLGDELRKRFAGVDGDLARKAAQISCLDEARASEALAWGIQLYGQLADEAARDQRKHQLAKAFDLTVAIRRDDIGIAKGWRPGLSDGPVSAPEAPTAPLRKSAGDVASDVQAAAKLAASVQATTQATTAAFEQLAARAVAPRAHQAPPPVAPEQMASSPLSLPEPTKRTEAEVRITGADIAAALARKGYVVKSADAGVVERVAVKLLAVPAAFRQAHADFGAAIAAGYLGLAVQTKKAAGSLFSREPREVRVEKSAGGPGGSKSHRVSAVPSATSDFLIVR